jgi:hypothetical protein
MIFEVVEGLIEQSTNEKISWSIDFTGYGCSDLDSATATAYDESTETDVSETVFPTNSPGVSDAVATCSPLRALTKGHTYRIEVVVIEDEDYYYESYFRVYCPK